MQSKPFGTSVAIIHRQKILLIQRAYEPYKGCWSFPGGRLEPNETVERCAVREVFEEVGLKIDQIRHIQNISINSDRHLCVFVATKFVGEVIANDEILDWSWSDPDDIGNLETTPELLQVAHRAFALSPERE